MNNLNFLIFQATTPTLELVMPMELAVDDAALVTIRQGDTDVLEYGLNAEARADIAGSGTLAFADDGTDTSVLLVNMSQADTLGLTVGDAELQLRVVTQDGADAFIPVPGAVGPAFRHGVLGKATSGTNPVRPPEVIK